MTCWRRLRDWHEAGVRQRLHELLLAGLNSAGAPDRSKAVTGSSHVRALKGSPKRGRARPDAVHAGRGHDHDKYRCQVRAKGITR
jgi:transposase